MAGPGSTSIVGRLVPKRRSSTRMRPVEIRLPFAGTLSDSINGNASSFNNGSTQFGNIFLAFKTLLYRTNTLAFSGGMSMTLPTANDITIANPVAGINQLVVHNNEVHLQPFLSFLSTPNDRFYWQGLCQVDMAARLRYLHDAECRICSTTIGISTETRRSSTPTFPPAIGSTATSARGSQASRPSSNFTTRNRSAITMPRPSGGRQHVSTLGVPGSNFGLL